MKSAVDPLAALIAEYRRQAVIAMEHPREGVDEDDLAAATFGPSQNQLCDAPPVPTSLAGVAEAIRLAIDDQTFIDQIGEQPLRACLSYLDEILKPSPIMLLFQEWNTAFDAVHEHSEGHEVDEAESKRLCERMDDLMVQIAALPPTDARDFAAKLSSLTHYGTHDELGGDIWGLGSAIIREAAMLVGQTGKIVPPHDRFLRRCALEAAGVKAARRPPKCGWIFTPPNLKAAELSHSAQKSAPVYPRSPEQRDNPPINLEVHMVSLQIVFIVSVALTAASGLAAAGLVIFGDTRKNAGQRAVAQTFAQIALLGAMAIISLLALPAPA